MASLLLTTDSTGSSQNITAILALATRTSAAAEVVVPSVRLSALNGAAAVITLYARHYAADGTTLIREQAFSFSKPQVTSTVAGDDLPGFLLASGEKLTIAAKSTNASDTAASFTISWLSGVAVDLQYILGAASVGAAGYMGPDWSAVNAPATTNNLSGTTVKTATDVETDTADLQTRLPAALSGGNMKSDVLAWNGTNVATPDTAGYPKVTHKTGTGAGELVINSGIADVNVEQWNASGAAVLNGIGGLPSVNVQHWAGSSLALVDSTGCPKVTIKDGTGTGELDTSSGKVFLAAAQTFDNTGTWTGNMTGNVGGNVVGSVASVVGNVGGNVVGTVILADASLTTAKLGVFVLAKTTNISGFNDIAAGAAMTLTSGERTAVANEVETQIIDETDSEKVLQAIIDKIAAANPSLDDLTLGAIASAVRDEIERVGGMLIGVNAKTTNLPANPANETTLAAVKAKTDNLPAAPANETTSAAIKAKTDQLTFTGTDVKATLDGEEVVLPDPAPSGYGGGGGDATEAKEDQIIELLQAKG